VIAVDTHVLVHAPALEGAERGGAAPGAALPLGGDVHSPWCLADSALLTREREAWARSVAAGNQVSSYLRVCPCSAHFGGCLVHWDVGATGPVAASAF